MEERPKSACKVGEFDFLQEVGRGSYGVVNKVRRIRDSKVCVIKEVLLERLGTDRERTLALNEAKIMKELSCPHIVEYLDAFTERGRLYLVLEFCELGNLKARYLRTTASVPVPKIWRMGLRIAMGLAYLHERRILHRDIKSENILLMPDDVVRIADLGLAKQLDTAKSTASTLCGTPRYLAPEMAEGRGPYSNKCDIWALGIILYELCSANHKGPFNATSLPKLLQQIVREAIPALPAKRTDAVMHQLIRVRLLAKDPAQRPAAAEILVLPEIVECGKKHGMLELQAPSEPSASPKGTPQLGHTCSLQEDGHRSTGSTDVSGSFAVLSDTEEPDGCWARVGRCVGQGSEEPGLGPRFHRRRRCEICAAQNLPGSEFTILRRRHHCRSCGRSVCQAHCERRRSLAHFGHRQPQRICDVCSLIPANDGEDCIPRTWTCPWIVTAKQAGSVSAWDTRSLSTSAWTAQGKQAWVGIGFCTRGGDERGPVVCTVSSQAGASLEMRALENGEVVHTTLLPLAAGGQGASTAASSRNGSRVSRAATIDAAACCGEWFAVARRDWSTSIVHVLGLPTGVCVGYAVLQEKVSAMAVQDGRNGIVVAGLEGGEVRVWDVPGIEEPFALRCSLEGHRQAVTCIVLASDYGLICSGSNNSLRLWRREQSGGYAEHKASEDHVNTGGSAITRAGSLLAFVRKHKEGSWERGVSLWSLAPAEAARFSERSLYKRNHSVSCVALCGSMLATSDSSTPRGLCTVQLWYAHTGTPVAVFRNPCTVGTLLIAEGLRTPPTAGPSGQAKR